MKQTSSDIQEIITGEPFQELDEILKIADEDGFVLEANEYELKEAMADLEQLLEYLETAIESEILDNFTHPERQSIIERLKKIRGELNNIKNDRNDHVAQLINQTADLKKLVLRELNLKYEVADHIDYSEQIQEIQELTEEQIELLSVLRDAEDIVSEISEFEQRLEEMSSNAQTELSNIQDLRSDVESEVDQFKSFLDRQNDELSNRRDEVDRLTNEIESDHERANQMTNNIENLEEQLSNNITKVDRLREELNNLVNRASSLQDDVDDLLSGAVSGTLGKRFEERKMELENSSRYWSHMTLVAVILLIGSAYLIFQDIVGRSEVGFTTISKLALLLPVSVAVWFTASNYGRERKLLEEYAFKTSVSLSLDGFREVLEKQVPEEEDSTISDFLISSMATIYTNPLFNLAKSDSDENPEDGTSFGTMRKLADSIRNRN